MEVTSKGLPTKPQSSVLTAATLLTEQLVFAALPVGDYLWF